MIPTSANVAEFGPFHFDPIAGELRRNGELVVVQEQPLRLLGLLLEQPGVLIGSATLVARLWPDGRFLDAETSLHTTVYKLRRALGERGRQAGWIETRPGRGLRFCGPVRLRCGPAFDKDKPQDDRPQSDRGRTSQVQLAAAATGIGVDADEWAGSTVLAARLAARSRAPAQLARALNLLAAALAQAEHPALWSALAATCHLAVEYGVLPAAAGRERARLAALRAQHLDPDCGGALVALAHYAQRYAGKSANATALLDQALALDPTAVDAWQAKAELCSQLADHHAARRAIGAALTLDPTEPGLHAVAGWLELHAGDLAACRSAVDAAFALDPTAPLTWYVAARLALASGDVAAALDICEASAPPGEELPGHPFLRAVQALALARDGRTEWARQAARQLVASTPGGCYGAAKVHLALGDRGRALRLLELAVAQRVGWVADLRVDPELSELRAAPAFGDLIRAVGSAADQVAVVF